MEFWGVEVDAGKPVTVIPDEGSVIHLSQACLGESKKAAADGVVVYGKIGEQKLVLGHLLPGKIPQLSFDLVFDQEFELSHNSKGVSVHFAGYQSVMGEDEGSDEFDSESDEELPLVATENGKIEQKADKSAATKSNAVKADLSGKQKVKIQEPRKDEADSDDSDDNSMDDDSDDDLMAGGGSSNDDDSADDSDEEEEETPTPKKPESKKRAQVSASATPVSAKKAKIVATTPQKTDGKKCGHTDTPHPAKKGKTPATDKSKAATPKSAGGNLSCETCSKTFGSDGALQSHNKAKHTAGK